MSVSNDLKIFIRDTRQIEGKEKLLGFEGNASSLYFSTFDDLILGNKVFVIYDVNMTTAAGQKRLRQVAKCRIK